MQVELKNNRGFKWYSNNNIHFKGYFWDTTDIYYRESEAIAYFSSISDINELNNKLKGINGLFCLVIHLPEKVFIVSDIIRSIPIFYRKCKVGYQISDDGPSLRNEFDILDSLSNDEFAGTGFVFGHRTLFQEINQNQAGQIIELNYDSMKVSEYYDYLSSSKKELILDNPVQSTKDIFLNSFKRFVKSLEGRQAILCLSGGYDSRLIAYMLKFFNHKKTLCITYGKKDGNKEVAISEMVAESLGFDWQFIEYNQEVVNGYYNSEEFNNYHNYAGNFAGMFMMHEYFAVKYLKENNLIDHDAIFVTGHSGDFLGGSQIAKYKMKPHMSIKTMINMLFDKKFVFQPYRLSAEETIKENLQNELGLLRSDVNKYYDYSIIENWDMKEKLSKFISNSSCVFDFWGYEYRLPYWDYQLTTYFKNMPFHFKENKELFNSVLREEFFEEYNLNFKKELNSSKVKMKVQFVKDRIKKILPSYIKQTFTKQIDHSNYRLICEPIFREISDLKYISPEKTKLLNTALIQWYLKKINLSKL